MSLPSTTAMTHEPNTTAMTAGTVDMDGDGVKDYALCLPECYMSLMVITVFSSITQIQGPSHGYYWDPPTFRPLVSAWLLVRQ